MKRLFFTCLSLFLGLAAFGQNGNEWVRFNQPYYKIPVAKDGLYRLTYADLQNAGFPVGTTNPLLIQLFHRGLQQRIRIQGELDGVFNPGDYIEFYGIKNTGVSDAPLYKPVDTQPHQYYNLYSDTTAYFLTVDPLGQDVFRMEPFSEVNVGGLPAETFHTDQRLMLITDEFYSGIKYVSFVQNTFFETGKGWTGAEIIASGSRAYTVTGITNTAQTAGNPTLEIQVAGRIDGMENQVEISIGPTSASRIWRTASFTGSQTATITDGINWSDIGADGKLFVSVRAVGFSPAGTASRSSVSYIKVTYPQTVNAASATEKFFTLNQRAGNKSYIEIQNPAANTRLFDVTDPGNVVPIGTTGTTTLNAVVNNTATTRKLLATSTFITPPIKKISFRNINAASGEYVIISHKILRKSSGQYSDPVKAYAEYRASSAGGSYDTLSVDMDQLYNQFNYGEVSPLAIHRFMRYMVTNGNPKYLFFIGKGLDVQQAYHRNPTAPKFALLKDLVPTAGMPASDIYYTAGLAGNGYEPAVPTGRITASTPQDVAAYLNKVKEMEALPFDALWRKELLHLSGGINPGEPEQFKFLLYQKELIAEDFYLGGKVTAIAKNSPGLEFINISDKVNSGLNLITLFGHSSPGQNDVNIGFVSASELGYNNQGKYPMFLINGCNAGDFFAITTRYGEDWINTPSKGAVGFMANTSFGFTEYLNLYADAFYSIAYGDSVFIHKGIGDIQKEVVRDLTKNEVNNSVQLINQAQQMLLLGDPAVPLFGANKPDYEINADNIFTESYTVEPITALSDSFALKIIVRNFGRAKEDTLTVRVVRTLSDNSTITYNSVFLPVLFRDTLTFTIYQDDKGFGENTFTVTVDALHKAAELNEENNTAVFTKFIPLNAAKSLYPQGFSIATSLTTNLVVQSADVLDEARDFTIQLDTLDTFDSEYRQEFIVNGKIATQQINLLTGQDTLAYYWRVKLTQPGPDESDQWSISTFTYIDGGEEGWAQVHFPQYMSNEIIGLTKDKVGRRIELQETITDVAIKTFGTNHPGFVTTSRTWHPELSVKVGDTEYHPISLISAENALACRKNTLNLIAFNKTTAGPYMPVSVQFPDSRACGRRPEVITSYSSAQVETGDGKDLIQYITNVQAGDSVILFSLGSPGYASYSTNVRNKLAELGISAAQLAALNPGEPVVIFARKGAVSGSAIIKRTSLSPADQQELVVEETVTGRYTSGEMTTSLIGPATEWKKLFTDAKISELPQTDAFSFEIIKVSIMGEKSVHPGTINEGAYSLSGIDAAAYPYIQLVFHATDAINLTSPQLKHWIVEYTPAAEGVITYTGSTVQQNVQQGIAYTNAYGFRNISQKEFSDSLTVQYTIYNTTQRKSEVKTKKILAPAPNEETAFNLTFNTEQMAGLNDVRVFVNPRVLPELYYDNNVIALADHLNVQGDVFNPVLDVTIDGRYVTNGDYVSANPAIAVRIWDENKIVMITDTTGVKLYLKYPCEIEPCDFTPIYFNRSDVQWTPATTTSNFRVVFQPQHLPEGTYTLRVEAEDMAGNPGGEEPYEITFVVAENNSIVMQRPYPNPSQGDVFFNVIVIGDQQPGDVLLEIMNANGQVIHTLTKRDLFVGTNVLVWQKQNITGGSVPPGMYLYRMIVIRDGKEVRTASGKIILK